MLMILLLHIFCALLGIAVAFYTLFRPSKQKVAWSYGLTAMTLTSGTYLVISTGSSILHACITGLCYLGLIFGALILAQWRLTRLARATHSSKY
jgi:hypothetical protein